MEFWTVILLHKMKISERFLQNLKSGGRIARGRRLFGGLCVFIVAGGILRFVGPCVSRVFTISEKLRAVFTKNVIADDC